MAETLQINSSAALDEQYILLIKQIKSLLNKIDHLITNLANLAAALKQTFSKISWVGFYLFDGEKLYLGPFQGKIACTEIKIGSGVCGTAAQKRETIIVYDVDKSVQAGSAASRADCGCRVSSSSRKVSRLSANKIACSFSMINEMVCVPRLPCR